VAAAEARTEEELRAEVARLRRELEARAKVPEVQIQRIPYVPPRVSDDLVELDKDGRALLERVQHLRSFVRTFQLDLAAEPSAPASAPPRTSTTRPPLPAGPKASGANGELPRGAREILQALAARHPTPLKRTQIATLVRMAPKGSTLRTYLGKLATAGLVTRTDDDYIITDSGLAITGPNRQPASAADLVALWRGKLTGKAKDMLEMFAAEHGPLAGHAIAERLGLDPSGSTFRTYLGHLRANGLVRKTTGGFIVADELAL
jgi:predicted transcriptional regulator